MKCKVSNSITLAFGDKNMDMHDIRVIYWLIPFFPHAPREFWCVNLILSTCH